MRRNFRWPLIFACILALFAGVGDHVGSSDNLFAADKAKDDRLDLGLFGRNLRAIFAGPENVPAADLEQTAEQVAEAQAQAVALQFEQQIRPTMIAELEFIRLQCDDLEIEQRKAIRRDAEAAVKKAAKARAAGPNRPQGIMMVHQNVPNSNPRDTIRTEIKKSSKSVMSQDQFEKYERALVEWTETKRRAAIDGAVAIIDHRLYLAQKQREQITNSFVEGWHDGWENWQVMSMTFGDQYFPALPQQLVTPFLTDEQKVVWKSIPRNNFEFWGGGQAIEFNEDGWWGPDPAREEGKIPANQIFQVLEVIP